MNSIQSLDISQVQALVEQGDLSAIAVWLNYHLNPRGVTVKVGWKKDCLGILLEASPFPEQAEMMALMRQHLSHLKLTFLNLIKVCGYQPGLSVPAWYEELELGGSIESVVNLNYTTPSLSSWINQGLEPEQLVQPALTPSEPVVEQRRFLRFHITSTDVALLPLSSIQEIVKVPVIEILPVPHMPDCIAGIYNWRGEMLWLVDVAQQLGFESSLVTEQNWATLTTIVLKSGHNAIGILIPRLLDVESFSPQQLHAPTAGLFPARLLSFLQGYLLPSTQPVLDAQALIRDPLLQVHCPR